MRIFHFVGFSAVANFLYYDCCMTLLNIPFESSFLVLQDGAPPMLSYDPLLRYGFSKMGVLHPVELEISFKMVYSTKSYNNHIISYS